MSDREMVYASTVVLRHPGEGEFARVLGPAPTGTRYRDPRPDRTTAGAQFPPAGKRYASKHAEHAPEKVHQGGTCKRWTSERIAALPRQSGMLTRVGDDIERGSDGRPLVPCACSGSSPRCPKKILVEASVYASDGRPQSCRPCAHERRRKAAAFTENGYAHARDFAAKERENHKAHEGVAA